MDTHRSVVADAWLPLPEPEHAKEWTARSVLLEILAATVLISTPRIVVEVGVERGYSSSAILAAMDALGTGQLFSIDLPSLREDEHEFVGRVIPNELRARWHLTLGPSQRELAGVLERVGTVDLFLHDGDHSYQSQIDDLRVVWPHLSSGGIAVVDDVWSPAIIDFALEVGESPLLVQRWDERDAIGLLRKSR